MSKRPFHGSSKPKSQAPNPGNLLAQVQQMQQQMAQAQQALADETVTISAGGGAVSVVITGHQRVQSIVINPELLSAEDVEMVQDLLVTAVNMAIEQSQALAAKRMEGITGGLGGLGGGLDSLLGGLGG